TMIGKLNLPAHLQPGSTPTILVANPVKSFATEPNDADNPGTGKTEGCDQPLRIRYYILGIPA
ncbi:hypothetical protein, partial [Sinorhizobium meliloti]|uniref:hypothetical protein n=1 Tax=Rhizobium meliloti TaxID=382 RepID=UPI000FE0D8CA